MVKQNEVQSKDVVSIADVVSLVSDNLEQIVSWVKDGDEGILTEWLSDVMFEAAQPEAERLADDEEFIITAGSLRGVIARAREAKANVTLSLKGNGKEYGEETYPADMSTRWYAERVAEAERDTLADVNERLSNIEDKLQQILEKIERPAWQPATL